MDGFRYLVDGLDTDLPWNIVNGTTYRPPVSVRAVQTEIPGRSGVYVPTTPAVFEAPILTLVLALARLPDVSLDAALDNLYGTFVRPGPVTITRVAGADTTAAAAHLVAITEPTNWFVQQVTTVTVTLRLPGVFFRGQQVISPAYPLVNDATVEVSTLSGSTAPITDPVLRLRGPAGGLAVHDPSTGTGITWIGVLPAGEYLYVDVAALTARRTTASNAWEVGGQPVSADIGHPVPGLLQMWPARTTAGPLARPVLLRIAAQGPRSTATELTVRAARAFW